MNIYKRVKKYKKLYKDDFERSKIEREDFLKTRRKLFWLIPLYLIFYTFDFYSYGLDSVLKNSIPSLILILTLFFYYNTYLPKVPKRLNDFQNYQLVINRRKLMVIMFGFLAVSIYALIFGLTPQRTFWSISLFAILSIILTIAVYIYKNPSQITSQQLTGLGTSLMGTYPLLLTLFFLSGWVNIGVLGTSILIIFIGYSSWSFFIKNKKEKSINLMQLYLIKIIPSDRLSYSMKPIIKQNKDKIRALKVLEEIEKKYPYGVKKVIEDEILAKSNKSNKSLLVKFFLTILLTLIGFLISSIGEGLVQDLFNDDIKRILCEKIKLYCK